MRMLTAIPIAVVLLGSPHHAKPEHRHTHATYAHMGCLMYGEFGGPNAHKVRCWDYPDERRRGLRLATP